MAVSVNVQRRQVNVSVGGQTAVGNTGKAVLYTPQILTEEQKAQARANIGVGAGGSSDPTAYGLPILALTGDTSAMTKDNEVSLQYAYGDRSGTCTMKWQGSSSLSWEKKNYTIKFDNAFEAHEGWGEQKKYCLKANFIDHSHARNVVSAKLWGQVVKARSSVTAFDVGLGVDRNDIYAIENGELIAVMPAHIDIGYLKDFSIPEDGFVITCEVFFPAEATDLSVVLRGYREDTKVTTGFQYGNATEAGVWQQIEIADTLWAAGSSTIIALQGQKTPGVRFRNIVATGLYNGGVYTFEPSGTELQSLVNGGAVDGFPVILTLNGEFHGLYTFNIPKDGWMFGMGDGTQEAIICADTQNEACGFKALATLTDDFELEYVTDENNTAWVLTSLNNCISAVMNSDGTDLDTTVAQYLDWDSAIDYLIFSVLLRGTDMYRKNYILATFDGVKWFFSAYDMDSTYGMQWDGKGFDSALGYPHINDYNHRVMELIYTYKKDKLKARYAQLRNSVMSEDNVDLTFENFVKDIPSPVLDEDVRKWTTIPSSSVNNVSQIRDWYRRRIAVIDKEVEAL